MEKEALYYEKLKDDKVRCLLCPHACLITPGKTGICGVRLDRGGTLTSMIYGEISSAGMDPIEKKPLYHFCPGSGIYSVGTVGCSFKCRFCQNHAISQDPGYPTEYRSPDDLAGQARRLGSIGIAYTYSEPLIWFEYVLDACKAARREGLKNVLVTNGYINPEPLRELLPHVDAFNIDLKSFSDDFYRKVAGGRLQPVLDAIAEVAGHGSVCLEVTTLVIPGHNDSVEEMERLTGFLASLRRDIPFHLSAYFPRYRFDAPPTPAQTLERLREVARKKLEYVYIGNVAGESNTCCARCGSLLVERRGYRVRLVSLEHGKCASCGTPAPVFCSDSS
jgi:pyruvate formate lyase activating enzyme